MNLALLPRLEEDFSLLSGTFRHDIPYSTRFGKGTTLTPILRD